MISSLMITETEYAFEYSLFQSSNSMLFTELSPYLLLYSQYHILEKESLIENGKTSINVGHSDLERTLHF
jgi:hypothetical protein